MGKEEVNRPVRDKGIRMTEKRIKEEAEKYAEENGWWPENLSDKDEMIEMDKSFAEAFEEGAYWRIRSVWHNMKREVPQAYGEYKKNINMPIPCLVRGEISTECGYAIRYWNVKYEAWYDEKGYDLGCNDDEIIAWCYLDDIRY